MTVRLLALSLLAAACGQAGAEDAGVPIDGGPGDSGAPDAGAARDGFGVTQLYPTVAGGREWALGDATRTDGEWAPETQDVTVVDAGVFQTRGASGQVRLNVPSPAGKLDAPLTWAGPWVEFRSDEMTIQFKWLSVREIAPLP